MSSRFPTAILLLLLAAGCKSVHRFDSTKHEVILVPEGVRDPAVFAGLGERIAQGKPFILKVAQGERMPFKLNLDLPMGALQPCESTFVYKHDTWFLITHKAFRVGPDGQRWADLTRPRAVTRLFGYQKGNFSFGFNSLSNEPPFMSVEVQVK